MTESVLPPTILIGSQKGGVGKSSIVANVGISIARRGRRVLLVDADQQGDLSVENVGVPEDAWDKGRNLASALQYGAKLEPYRNARPNLDIVMGGASLALVSSQEDLTADAGIDVAENLRLALQDLCERERYDIVIVDSGHGNIMLLLALLQVCTYLVVPTREDMASIKGVQRLATSYARAKSRGSQISLLGVALFQVNPRATARNSVITKQISEMLDGSDVEPFTAAIRHAPGPALAERHRHMAAEELVAQADQDKSELLEALREGRSEDIPRLHAADPIAVANDYQNLTREILLRVQATLAANAS